MSGHTLLYYILSLINLCLFGHSLSKEAQEYASPVDNRLVNNGVFVPMRGAEAGRIIKPGRHIAISADEEQERGERGVKTDSLRCRKLKSPRPFTAASSRVGLGEFGVDLASSGEGLRGVRIIYKVSVSICLTRYETINPFWDSQEREGSGLTPM